MLPLPALELFLCRCYVVVAVAAPTAAEDDDDDEYADDDYFTTTPAASVFVGFRNQYLPHQLVP